MIIYTIFNQGAFPQTLHNVLLLREICCQFADFVPFFEKVNYGMCMIFSFGSLNHCLPFDFFTLFAQARSVISGDLYRASQLMDKVIDFQTSEQMKRFVVLTGVDNDLDKSKYGCKSMILRCLYTLFANGIFFGQ